MRKAGVLMPLFSLPGDYIGDLGPKSYEFVDILVRMGMKIWQLLPLNPVGFGNSPYQPLSSFAGDICYISTELLGFEQCGMKNDKVDYEKARYSKETILKEVFKDDSYDKKEYLLFLKENIWVENYAIFSALKKHNEDCIWNDWSRFSYNNDEVNFIKFCQYLFFKQLKELKRYANKNGIELMGDIPFYVGHDSADVWENQNMFLLLKDHSMNYVSGVEPDYFSKYGQKWGNPLYDWNKMEKKEYAFWLKRISVNSEFFDILRIDHFRAFESFYEIPIELNDARVGRYSRGPGRNILSKISSTSNVEIVVEDLGLVDDAVYQLRDEFNFPGMNIVEFFDSFEREVVVNSVTYTSTHDNQTIKGWYENCDKDVKKGLNSHFGVEVNVDNVNEILIEYAMNLSSRYTIISVQDILCLSDETRINKPGIIDCDNWKWKLVNYDNLFESCRVVKKIVEKAQR